MRVSRAALAVAGAGLVASLTACSFDTVIWGSEGAGVIAATDRMIAAAASGDGDAIVCTGAKVDFGDPDQWEGVSPGEPGEFTADFWREQERLDPDWTINLEIELEGTRSGILVPGDVFYRETSESLCVVDLVWATIESVG